MARKLDMDELGRLSVEDFKNSEKKPICIALDNIRSLHNVGSVFRSADAFSVQKIFLGGITGTPPNKEINKTALGATESVEWEHADDLGLVFERLKKEGWQIVIVEQTDNSMKLNDFKPLSEQKYCFVFGNEVFGVDDQLLKHADLFLEIPQSGTKHSLNISVAAGIVLWDYVAKLFGN